MGCVQGGGSVCECGSQVEMWKVWWYVSVRSLVPPELKSSQYVFPLGHIVLHLLCHHVPPCARYAHPLSGHTALVYIGPPYCIQLSVGPPHLAATDRWLRLRLVSKLLLCSGVGYPKGDVCACVCVVCVCLCDVTNSTSFSKMHIFCSFANKE